MNFKHILIFRYHLTMHVKNKHGLTIGEYNQKHMQVWVNILADILTLIGVHFPPFQLHNVEYNGTSLSFDKGRKIGTQKVGTCFSNASIVLEI